MSNAPRRLPSSKPEAPRGQKTKKGCWDLRAKLVRHWVSSASCMETNITHPQLQSSETPAQHLKLREGAPHPHEHSGQWGS